MLTFGQPFIIGAVIAVLLNSIMPEEKRDTPLPTMGADYPRQQATLKEKE